MTARVLDYEFWGRLDGTGLKWKDLDRERVFIVVAEDEKHQIVGYWVLMWALHANGAWIDPAHRKTGLVARELVAGMKAKAATLVPAVLVSSVESEEISGLLTHLGASLVPGDEYLLRVS